MFEFMKDTKNHEGDLKGKVKIQEAIQMQKEHKTEHEFFTKVMSMLCDAGGDESIKASLALVDKSERCKFIIDDVCLAFMNAEKRCEDKKYVRAMQQTADYFGLVLTGLRQYMEELKKQDIPGVKWDE